MSEILQTRTEHSRSVEDAERYRAIDTLKELGLLIPVTELETFHGRVGTKEDATEWAVDPSFANGSNDSGNSNVNDRPTLYTGEEQVAKDFAVERVVENARRTYNSVFEDRVNNYTSEERRAWLDRENKRHQEWFNSINPEHREPYGYLLDESGNLKPKTFDNLKVKLEARRLENETSENDKKTIWRDAVEGLKPEVHEIVTDDIDATVIDFSFDESKLDEASKEEYAQALQALAIPVTEGSPVSWSDRDTPAPFIKALIKAKKRMVFQGEVGELAAEAGIGEDAALQLASAYNSLQIALTKPSYLASQLVNHSSDIITDNLEIEGERKKVPINLEYVQRYLREAHIVGARQSINSITLGKEIASVSFFDLEKTTTAEKLKAERQAMQQRLGSVATGLGEVMQPRLEQKQSLLKQLEDAHARPDKLVAKAKLVEGYEAIFNADAGNWEGFTLAQHTETVLRNFDESYAETLPVGLLAPMRLAILVHDIGKPVAVAHGEKHRQKEYNIAQADDFLKKLGVEERLKDMLVAVIGDGQELAHQIEVNGVGEPAVSAMKELAVDTLQRFYGSEDVTDEQINGFVEMCKILQVCDGGAYTSMAITNRGKGQGRHRNAPTFNSSFAEPVGFGKRAIRPKDNNKTAALNLTPKAAERQSRVRVSNDGAGRKAPKITA